MKRKTALRLCLGDKVIAKFQNSLKKYNAPEGEVLTVGSVWTANPGNNDEVLVLCYDASRTYFHMWHDELKRVKSWE